ncbi:MAG: YcaO-related McrA-glycine thioamidation protein [Methanomassiliicoccales archaeon]|nr:MAG: YcaO-related McrA-glycine thioamidation protein [Methanomassiliicoccales archaeon]
MQLVSRPKYPDQHGDRTVAAEDALKRIEPLRKIAGITRIADITGLDRVGIYVFSSIRPEAKGGAISVYNGKGLTPVQAKVSAIMEGIERYSAEMWDEIIVWKRVKDMVGALDPMELIIPPAVRYQLSQYPIAWVPAFDICSGKEIQVPACAVFHPYYPRADLQLFRSNTNGLASGNNIEEAILHGLCEVIERDAWSICEGRRRVNSDLDISGTRAEKVASMFTDKGIELHFKDLTSDIGMPVVAVAADDIETKDPGLLTLGIGANPDPEVAAIKALIEVAQSRLTQIHGAREDTVHADRNRALGYERVKRINRLWFEDSGQRRDLVDLENLSTNDILEDINVLTGRLSRVGLDKVLVCDLTRKELGIPVVRVIVPGAEIFAIDPDRVGARLMRACGR